jgi:hypothetical protein
VWQREGSVSSESGMHHYTSLTAVHTSTVQLQLRFLQTTASVEHRIRLAQ